MKRAGEPERISGPPLNTFENKVYVPLVETHRGNPGRAIELLQASSDYELGEQQFPKAAYNDFFAFWKNADPDIRVYKAAKTEYTRLQ